ncbi:MAG: zinc metallopeptidase [Eubacteriales bacterium]
MMYFDWTWFLIIPALLLGLWAQSHVKRTYNKYAKVFSSRGVQAQDVVADILRTEGCSDVRVQTIGGELTDNYNPQNKTLNLSQTVYGSSSIAAIGVAAHEAGHAIQHNQSFGPLMLRSVMVPVVRIGSGLAWPIFIFGLILSFPLLMDIGIIAFSLAVLFSLITLPVELNASHRAIRILAAGNYLTETEVSDTKKVLTAAALTYVAAALASILQLVRLLVLRGRR